jgi:hypothetical protein
MPNSTEIRFGACQGRFVIYGTGKFSNWPYSSRKTNNLPFEQLRQRRYESSMNRKGVSFPSDDETRTGDLFAVDRQIACWHTFTELHASAECFSFISIYCGKINRAAPAYRVRMGHGVLARCLSLKIAFNVWNKSSMSWKEAMSRLNRH